MTVKSVRISAYIDQDGSLTPCNMSVSEPIKLNDDQYFCWVEYSPLFDAEKKILGIDAEQSRGLAWAFLENLAEGNNISDAEGNPIRWSDLKSRNPT